MSEPDTKQIEKQSHAIITTANAFAIECAEDYRIAGTALQTIKHWRGQVAEAFDPVIKAGHLAHKAGIAAKKKHDDPLAAADRTYRGKMSHWQTEQERLRREQEAAARAEALRQAEEERLAEAAKAEAAGQTEQAEALIQAPIIPAAVVIAKTTPKVEGISARKTYEFEIYDENILPREYVMPNESKIRRTVNNLGKDAGIRGVTVTEKQTIAVRSV